MSLISILDLLLLEPLERIYGWIFDGVYDWAGTPEAALVGLSIALNLVLLPIYYQMERAGRVSANRQAAMDKEVARMKANFEGRERYYYVKAVHRQFGYRPISAVFRSGDLFLQILVFATVFRYIADQPYALDGPLSQPDGALFGLNLLPILMTLASIASAIVYDADPKRRRQSFVLAALFLVLLYASPAALVLYWTSNSVFSLLRNLIKRGLASRPKGELSEQLARLAVQE